MKSLNYNPESNYMPVPEFAKSINVSERTARRIALEANALLKIGKSSRVICDKCLAYMEKEYQMK